MSELAKWLQQKKQEAQMTQQRSASPSFSPLRERYLGNTGPGPNGVVEPSRPTHVMAGQGGPVVLDEGEDVYQKGDQVRVVPANQSQGMQNGAPVMPGEQQEEIESGPIGRMCSGGKFKVRRMQTGGTFETPKPEAPKPLGGVSPTTRQTRQGAMNRLRDTATTGGAIGRDFQKQIGDFQAASGTQQQVQQHQAAQQGLAPEISAGRMAMQKAQTRQAEAGLRSQAAVQTQAARERSQNQLLAATDSQQNFERSAFEADRDFELREGSHAAQMAKSKFMDAAEFGDDATVRAAYAEYFGQDMAEDASVDDIRNFAKTKRSNELTRDNVQLDGLKNRVGQDKFNNLVERVDKGASYTALKGEFPNLTEAEFDNMVTERNNRLTIQAQAVEQAKSNTDRMKQEYDANEWSNLMAMVRDNAPLESIVAAGYNITGKELADLQATTKAQVQQAETSAEGLVEELGQQKYVNLRQKIKDGVPYNELIRDYPTLGMGQYDAMREWEDMEIGKAKLDMSNALHASATKRLSDGVPASILANDPQFANLGGTFEERLDVLEAMEDISDIGIDAARTELESMKESLGAQKYNNMVNDIQAGMQFHEAQKKYPGLTGTQYATMFQDAESERADEDFASLTDMINSGATYDQIRQDPRFRNVSESQFNSLGSLYQLQVNKGEELVTQMQTETLSGQLGLSVAETTAAWNMAGQGYSAKEINKKLETDLTSDQVEDIRSTTPFGATEYTRKLNGVATLLELGGENNIKEASGVMNDLFGDALGNNGVSFDFNNVITEGNQEEFKNATSNLSLYANTTDSFEEAFDMMKGDGTLSTFESTWGDEAEEKAREMYDVLKVNAIDEQWNAIEQSSAYKNLSPEKKEEFNAVWADLMFSTKGYTFSEDPETGELTVTDAEEEPDYEELLAGGDLWGKDAKKLLTEGGEGSDQLARDRATEIVTGNYTPTPGEISFGDPTYKAILANTDVPTFTGKTAEKADAIFAPEVPAEGELVKINGQVFKVGPTYTQDVRGQSEDRTYYTFIDIATGKEHKWKTTTEVESHNVAGIVEEPPSSSTTNNAASPPFSGRTRRGVGG